MQVHANISSEYKVNTSDYRDCPLLNVPTNFCRRYPSNATVGFILQMIFSLQVCCPYPQLLALSRFVSLSEQPEVVWVGLVSVLRFRFHQYRYSVKNLTACRQLVRRHVQRKKMRYRCYPVLSSVRSAATRSYAP